MADREQRDRVAGRDGEVEGERQRGRGTRTVWTLTEHKRGKAAFVQATYRSALVTSAESSREREKDLPCAVYINVLERELELN